MNRPFWPAGALSARPGLRACLLGGGAAAAAGGSAVVVFRHHHRDSASAGRPPHQHHHQQQQPGGSLGLPRLKLSAAAIEACAGAMGEVAQISLLYPLVSCLRCFSKCWTRGELIQQSTSISTQQSRGSQNESRSRRRCHTTVQRHRRPALHPTPNPTNQPTGHNQGPLPSAGPIRQQGGSIPSRPQPRSPSLHPLCRRRASGGGVDPRGGGALYVLLLRKAAGCESVGGERSAVAARSGGGSSSTMWQREVAANRGRGYASNHGSSSRSSRRRRRESRAASAAPYGHFSRCSGVAFHAR